MSSFRFSTRTAGSTRRPTPPRTSSGPTPSSTYTDGVGASSGPPKHAAQMATRHACCAYPPEPPRACRHRRPRSPRGLSSTDQLINNELVRPRRQRLPDSIEPGHRTRRSRRIRWRRRNRSDKQRQPKQARPRSPSRRRRPRAGNSTATCPRRASPLTSTETQTPRPLARCVFDALARKRQRPRSGDRKSFRRRSG